MTQPNPADTFRQEAEELLAQIEEVALDLPNQSSPAEAVNQLFRAFHTIKGSGSMFGFEEVAAFTHHVETAMDHVREGRLPLSAELIGLVLAAADHIKALLNQAEGSVPDAGQEITAALAALSPTAESAQAESAQAESPQVESREANVTEGNWCVRFRPNLYTLTRGGNPLSLLNELRALGECRVIADPASVPTLDQLQSDLCYFAWEIALPAYVDRNAMDDVFIFSDDSQELRIERAAGPAELTADEGDSCKIHQMDEPASCVPNPSIADRDLQRPFEPGTRTPAPPQRNKAGHENVVRVPSEKLDRLVNLVGELVMNQSRLTQAASNLEAANLAVPVEEIERLVAELRDCVLGIRMMPIAATFKRFKRLVHDLSAELGKEIDLVTEGEETELDKTVLDRLADPLVHLIRNSLDHGIETAAERLIAGKSSRGTLRLTAVHTGSNVVIGIHDDGRGLDAAAIRAKAVEKALVARDADLSEKEILNLIFLPGFSTAKQITSVSGRGVGMDAVKRQIETLRGTVSVSTQPGKGTSISMTLPLTLAIIDGLLVQIGNDQFIVPMSIVLENMELSRSERFRNNGRNIVAVRGELSPYVRLRELFEIPGDAPEIEKVVLVRHEEQRVGLVVDRVLGSHQTVIQSLGVFYRNISLVSGATIMGDGRVALILDVAGLLKRASAPSTHQYSPRTFAA